MIDDLAGWMDGTFKKYRNMPVHAFALGPKDDMVSETDASDSGIMFVPKRRESSGSDSSGTKCCNGNGTPRVEDGYKQAGASRITGHTITEMELVRRRRLQDAHLFD